MFHLAGDPLDSLGSLMHTLHVAQIRWRCIRSKDVDKEACNRLALIITAADECGVLEDMAREFGEESVLRHERTHPDLVLTILLVSLGAARLTSNMIKMATYA